MGTKAGVHVYKGRILTTADGEDYTKALERNSPLSVLPTPFIFQPSSYADIPSIFSYARSQNPPLEIAVKGGGVHTTTWASSDKGLVIDLGKLRSVTVSEDKQSVTVQGGALWGDVYEELAKFHLDVVGGPLWFVGVGGFLLGGGYGPFAGQRGLAIDNIISATVALADGRIVKTSATEEPDLFWAIRGGGGQFGILAEVVLKAFPSSGPYTGGVIAYPGTELEGVLKLVKDWKKTSTPKEKLNMSFVRPGPNFQPTIMIMPWISEDQDSARSKTLLAPFREGSVKPVMDKCHPAADMLALSHGADRSMAFAPKRLKIRGALIADFYDNLVLDVYARWLKFTENEDTRSTVIWWDLTHSAKIGEVGSSDTAVPVRSENYWVAAQGRTNNPAADASVSEFISETVKFIRQKNTELSGKDYGYPLFTAQGDEKPEDVFGANLPRLRELKAKYDPTNLFKKTIQL